MAKPTRSSREPRTGRRPGPSSTRDEILRAARRRFAEGGYERATFRSIAADAGVDPALVVSSSARRRSCSRPHGLAGDLAELVGESERGRARDRACAWRAC